MPKAKPSPATHRKKSTRAAKPSHVVGIGASAGGLSALEEFFDHMPSRTGLAFVIVQHLSPDFKSLMDDLLARHTEMRIHRVVDSMQLEPDSIYLIPPKSHMTVKKSRLFLTEVNTSQHADLPIDVFFTSLAAEWGGRSFGVILSGTGTDGSRGVKALREADGIVLVQSPETAQFDGMPRSAIATDCCDLMTAPRTMPEVILQVAQAPAQDRRQRIKQYLADQPSGENQQIFAVLKNHYNLDFSHYKPTTVGRRIQRRLDVHQLTSLSDYVPLLSSNEAEANALYHDLLIGVTEFFRDPAVFSQIEEQLIPAIFADRKADEDIRVWSAGCATGEEAYSLGILLAEHAEEVGFKGTVTVFATDVHRDSLDFASHGRYSRDRLKNVAPERLERYFEPAGEDHYRVNQVLRKMIVFAPHNLINDPPFTRMDLIVCRNLLIYLQPDIQEKVFSLFHFALKVNGYLVLGPSEGLGKMAGEFKTVDGPGKLFRKLRDLNLAINMNFDRSPARFSAPSVITATAQKNVSLDRRLIRDYDALLNDYIPTGILIDEDRKILHNFGDVSSFQKPVQGRFENDLLAMVDDALKVPLTSALHRATKTGEQVKIRGITLEREGQARSYDLQVKYIGNPGSRDGHYFVSLIPVKVKETREPTPVPEESELDLGESPGQLQQRIVELEQELQATRENLQTTVQELQTANEELQATNEELMASNEELQSTNEELHSVNEELYTVNAEFEDKNFELKELNQDHVNLLNSLEIGIVYIDDQLKIRKFNPEVEKIFHLLPQDVGRPIDHIAYHLANQAQMLKDVRQVHQTGEPVEKDVQTDDQQWLFKRILPCRDSSGAVQGVLLTFTDISVLKTAEETLREHAEALEREVEDRTRRFKEAKEAADRANVAKSSFLANMSHEIRTPMSGVLMAAELLAEMELPQRQADLVKTLQRGALSLNDILDEILDFSKIEAGKVEMIREPLIVEDTIHDVLALYQPRIEAKQLALTTRFDDDIPEIMLGDPGRLKQILTNLVANAVKFTAEGEISVTADVQKCTADNCILHFEVRDTGIGIPVENREKIFEPFAQGDASLTRQYGGTGLGLSISKRLVELMGGRMWLQDVEEGSSFHFTVVLDLLKRPAAGKRSRAAQKSAAEEAVNALVCRVLLAEDDTMNQELIIRMVRNIGCDISLVNNGQEAVDMLQQESFDLVLMDISMPVLDGVSATEHIRRFEPHHPNYEVPIIALTAHAMAEDIQKFIGSGMNQVLTKPLSKLALQEAILNHCEPGRKIAEKSDF